MRLIPPLFMAIVTAGFWSAVAGVPGHAQEPSEWSVAGKVLSADTGEPVKNAQVYFESERDGTLIGVLSDADGGFALSVSAADSVLLHIEKIGYCRWKRVITPDMQTEGLVVELLPYVVPLDEITPGYPGAERSQGGSTPISRGSVACHWQEEATRSGRTFRLDEPVPWDISLREVAETVLQHPDVVDLGNQFRGDEPLVVAVDDPSLDGTVNLDNSLPHRFATRETAWAVLDQNETQVIAILALQEVRGDALQLRVIFGAHWRASGDRLPSIDVTVAQEPGGWRLVRP